MEVIYSELAIAEESAPSPVFGEDSKGRQRVGKFYHENEESFRYALVGGGWLDWRWTYWKWSIFRDWFQKRISFSFIGSELEAGQ